MLELWFVRVRTLAEGGDAVAGGAMKEIGSTHWQTPYAGATNISGFTGLPGGERFGVGNFGNIGNAGYWWSSTEDVTNYALYRYLYYSDGSITRFNYTKPEGFSVRCIRD